MLSAFSTKNNISLCIWLGNIGVGPLFWAPPNFKLIVWSAQFDFCGSVGHFFWCHQPKKRPDGISRERLRPTLTPRPTRFSWARQARAGLGRCMYDIVEWSLFWAQNDEIGNLCQNQGWVYSWIADFFANRSPRECVGCSWIAILSWKSLFWSLICAKIRAQVTRELQISSQIWAHESA